MGPAARRGLWFLLGAVFPKTTAEAVAKEASIRSAVPGPAEGTQPSRLSEPRRQDLAARSSAVPPLGVAGEHGWLARLKKRDNGVWRGPVIPGDSGAGHPCRCLPGNGSWRLVVCCVQTSWPLGAGQCSVPHSGAHAATGPSLLALSSSGPGGSNLPASEELSGGAPRGSAACRSRRQTLPGLEPRPEPHF